MNVSDIPVAKYAIRASKEAADNCGVRENGPPFNNRGRYIDTYLSSVDLHPGDGEDGYPWCAAFVNYRVRTACHELGVILPVDKFIKPRDAASAGAWADWAKANGLWIAKSDYANALPGDLVCFDIASEGGIHHIGILRGHNGLRFITVEGNTHGDGDVVRDGYCVAQRLRWIDELGEHGGFIRLPEPSYWGNTK